MPLDMQIIGRMEDSRSLAVASIIMELVLMEDPFCTSQSQLTQKISLLSSVKVTYLIMPESVISTLHRQWECSTRTQGMYCNLELQYDVSIHKIFSTYFHQVSFHQIMVRDTAERFSTNFYFYRNYISILRVFKLIKWNHYFLWFYCSMVEKIYNFFNSFCTALLKHKMKTPYWW